MWSSVISLPPGIWLILAGVAMALLPSRALWPVRQALLVGTPLATLGLVLMLPDGHVQAASWLGLDLQTVAVDPLARIFALAFAIMALGGAVFAWDHDNNRELGVGLAYAGAAISVPFAGDWLTLFVFWEIMAIAATILVFAGGMTRSYGAGMRYAGIHFLSGVLLMAGVAGEVSATGTAIIQPLDDTTWPRLLMLAGVLINVGALPFWAWIADAYPESSWFGMTYLQAFTTKAAVFVLIAAFPGVDWFVPLGLVMIFYGIVYALLETDMRRILAYSLVAQLGFMVVGVGLGTENGLNGAAAQAFVGVIYGGLLTMVAGTVLRTTGRRRTTELGGLARLMPVTCACCVIGALAVSAVPLTSGYPGKSLISEAAGEQKHLIAYVGLLAGSVGLFIQAGLMFPWLLFFQAPGQSVAKTVSRSHLSFAAMPASFETSADASSSSPPVAALVQDPILTMRVAMVAFAGLCVLFGVLPGLLYGLMPTEVAFSPYSFSKLLTQVELLVFGALGFVLLTHILPRTHTVTLDLDWLYRVLGQNVGQQFQAKARATETRFGDGAMAAVRRIIATLYRHHGPQGVLGRQWQTGNMAFWTTVLLGVSLVISMV